MRAPVRAAAISGSGDLKVCGLPLVDADDALAVDTGVNAVGDGLDLGKLGHRD